MLRKDMKITCDSGRGRTSTTPATAASTAAKSAAAAAATASATKAAAAAATREAHRSPVRLSLRGSAGLGRGTACAPLSVCASATAAAGTVFF